MLTNAIYKKSLSSIQDHYDENIKDRPTILTNDLVDKNTYITYKSKLKYRTRAIISGRSKISMARKFSKISMLKTLKPYFLDIIVDTKA